MMPRLIRNNRTLTAILSVLLIAACTVKRPSDVLPPEKLESVLYDYHLTQSIISDMPASERYKKDLYFDYIYAKHGVTAAEVDSSLVYYARYPKELSEIYIKLSEKIEGNLRHIEQEDLLVLLRTPQAVEGDSADLWYDSRLVLMSPSRLSNRFSTEVPYDANFESNDRLEWSGKVLFFRPDVDSLYRYLHLSLMVKYANDSLTTVDTTLYTTGTFHLVIADTAGYKLRSVSGDAYYKGADDSDDILLYANHLMRYREAQPTDTIIATDSLNQIAPPKVLTKKSKKKS